MHRPILTDGAVLTNKYDKLCNLLFYGSPRNFTITFTWLRVRYFVFSL